MHSPWVWCAFSPPRFQPQFPPAPVGCVLLVFSHNHPSGCQPSSTSGSLWLETEGLFAVWEGMPSLGPNFPFPLPPASYLRRGWASLPQASSSLEFLSPFVLRTAGSVFGLVNFLSVSCYPTI